MSIIPWSDGTGAQSTWWMRPGKRGKCLMLGPIQINWYEGLWLHVTWPFRWTLTLWNTNA